MLVVGHLNDAESNALTIPLMREIMREVLEAELVRSFVAADGTTVDATHEELSRTEVVEVEGGRPVGVRPVYILTYRESRINQGGILKLSPLQFRDHMRYLIGNQRKLLSEMQPALEWSLCAVVVDPVNMTRRMADVVHQEPTLEEVSVRLAGRIQQLSPNTGRDAPPERLSSVARNQWDERDWRWYVRQAWVDVSGGQDFTDPAERMGYRPSGLAKFSETRQLRHLPRGTRKNREEALELVKRAGQAPQIAPAAELGAEQVEAARQMVEAGTNLALVARALGVAPAAVQGLLGEQAPAPAPSRSARRG